MFFVTAVKDYIDLLNNLYDSVSGNLNLQEVSQQTLLYFFSSIKFLILYFISFQWIKDLSYLPVLIPQVSTTMLKENYFIDSPLSNLFTLLEIPTYENNKFLIGFLNSFFLCLPLSTTHLISIRRLLVQGLPAGIVSSIGTIFGHFCLLICVLFGLRLMIIPWFNYEPLNYFVGIGFIVNIVYNMAHERGIRKIAWSEKSQLLRIFFLNFILAWTEQSCIFTYFGNLTLTPQPSILDNFSSITKFGLFLSHSTYLSGILIGSLCFTSLFTFIYLQTSNLILSLYAITYSRWLKTINFGLSAVILTLSFGSIPFYSLDYLFGNPLGFISQDKAFEKTLFSSKNLKDYLPGLLTQSADLGSLATDTTPFDRGKYLLNDSIESFEDLNYRGEYAWTARNDYRAIYGTEKSRNFFSNLFPNTSKDLDTTQIELDDKNPVTNKLSSVNENNAHTLKVVSSSNKKNKLTSDSKKPDLTNLSKQKQSFDYLSDDDPLPVKNQVSFDFSRLNNEVNNDFIITDALTPILNTSFSQQYFSKTVSVLDPKFEKNLKQKYYSNPVYKTLLNVDIDLFLRRQPSSFLLTPQEEAELFKKRLILSNYYDNLRQYQELPYIKDFQEFFSTSKSYADRVYNQQFKGTLKIVRRLFSVTFNEQQNLPDKIILKFDQPLYTNLKKKKYIIEHEELILDSNEDVKHPFIKLTSPIPFYTGWDEQLRKLVITNRLLPRSTAGYTLELQTNIDAKNYGTLSELLKKTKKVDFTTWPLTRKILKKNKTSLTMPYSLLYERINDPKNQLIATRLDSLINLEDQIWQFKTVPSNFKRIDPYKLNGLVPMTTRGGFFWPGHSYLKFSFKNFITENTSKIFRFSNN